MMNSSLERQRRSYRYSSGRSEMSLEDFLESSAAEGTSVDSGGFTISHIEAWRKLKQTLPKQQFWILKMLQTAVLWRAEEMIVNKQDTSCTVTIQPLAEVKMSASELLEISTADRALDHLRVGLAGACADPQFTSVAVEWRAAEESFRLEWAGEDDVSIDSVESTEERPTLTLTASHKGAGWFKSALGRTAFSEEEHALKERAWTDKVVVRVNGRTLRMEREEVDPFRKIVLANLRNEGELLSLDLAYSRWLELPRYYEWMNSSSKSNQRKRDCGAHPVLGVEARILWVLDGVVVDEWRAEARGSTAVGSEMVVSAEGLECDISGFSLRPTAALKKRVEAVKKRRAEVLREALTEVDLEKKLAHAEAWKKVKRSAIGANLFVGFFFPPLLAVLLVELFRVPNATKRVLAEDIETCRAELKKREEIVGQADGEHWRSIGPSPTIEALPLDNR